MPHVIGKSKKRDCLKNKESPSVPGGKYENHNLAFFRAGFLEP